MRTLIKATLRIAATATLFACKPKPEANDDLPPLDQDDVASAVETPAPAADRIEACTLRITCTSNDSLSVSISSTAPGSAETDIPLSGGTYPIWGKQQAPSLKGGQILRYPVQHGSDGKRLRG